MAKSLNRVTLLGILGQDPEFKVTPQGSSVCKLNIATTESYKDKNSGEWKDNTYWHRVTLWEGLADTANKYLKKGNKVYIEGKLKTRSYDDREGNKKYITEVLASSLIMMGGGGNSEGGNNGGSNYSKNESYSQTSNNDESDSSGFDSDLPF